MKRKLARLALGVGMLALALQVYPRPRLDNPPVTSGIEAPEPVKEILRRCCYDCHSHQTRWPWYGRIAPLSWLIAEDVSDARAVLNFSTWGSLDRLTQAYNRGEVLRRVTRGQMPPRRYLWMHPAGRLQQEDLAILKAWAGKH